ncbi:MAG: hypothetical protein RLZZ469_61 [Bacteroidota bacterium]
MKNKRIEFGVFMALLISMISCKNDKTEATAEERIGAMESYVDSLESVKADEAEANWERITVDYDRRMAEADAAITSLRDEVKKGSQERLDSVKARYFFIKSNLEASKAPVKVNYNQRLRDTFFGTGKLGEDMSFSWVNKDNILQTYQTFFEAYKANKGNFTREDYDEVKMIYEALDSRKNTVENEGLSSEDNNKIAAIKFKFAPMFKVNRIGAKARENEEAKE